MKDKLEGLQVVRAIAALTVVIFHAKLTLMRFPKDEFSVPFFFKYGHVGVPVFFVVSGFIISHVLLRDSFKPADFIQRRFWRLWPLYVVCTLGYAAVYMMQRNMPSGELGITFESMARSLVFWPQGKYPVLPPGWSLEHEVIFYLYGAIIAGLFGYRVFFVFMGVIGGLSVWWWNFGPAQWDWHLMARANAYFFIGMVTYSVWRWGAKRFPGSWTLAPLGLAGIVAGCYWAGSLPSEGMKQAGMVATAGPGAALLVYGLLSVTSTNPLWRFGLWVGDRSYSLYLSHFMLVAIFQTVHRDLVKWPAWMAGPMTLAFVVASLILMAIVYHVFERTTAHGYRQAATSYQPVASKRTVVVDAGTAPVPSTAAVVPER